MDIEFPEGLVIITGQTGAGKSILIGSISLLLGAKADATAIGEAGDNCIVEGEFDLTAGNGSSDSGIASPSGSLRATVEESGAEWDDTRLVIRRVIGRSGRSRAFLNDCPVPLATLSSISSSLIDIHSQHQTLMLSDKAFRLSILDHYAGNGALLKDFSAAYSSYVSMKAELEELDRRIRKAAEERDYDQARFERLDSAGLRDGELEELEAEQKQLANAEEIKENLYAVEVIFSPEADEIMSIDEALRESERHLGKVIPFVPRTEELQERIVSARVELDDILSDIKRINTGIEVSQERLTEVEERIALIYDLLRKFSCRAVVELIALRDELGKTLHDSTELVERREELSKAAASQLALAESLASKLHEARENAAGSFASAIEESLHFLELPYAAFEVELQDVPLCAAGTDSVVFRFSASGKNPVDVAKCASGGEMSRIMLCLKDMMARYTNMPTMIFDEIDTGVSGSTADRMGAMICAMGENMQVFAITHLPQVAAKGRAHYVVSKSIDPATLQSVTTISKLSDEARVLEVARMLSGSSITDAAVENAKSLLRE
ncbi:MAG: DNA repair protein RecN [Bacteroidales bacterium]|nr:DNA repair protein RecN [Bacteroidales bacterium]